MATATTRPRQIKGTHADLRLAEVEVQLVVIHWSILRVTRELLRTPDQAERLCISIAYVTDVLNHLSRISSSNFLHVQISGCSSEALRHVY